MKKHKMKSRYLFLIISFSVMIIGYLIYSVTVGQNYRIIENVGGLDLDSSSVKVECSDESVIKVNSLTKYTREDGMNIWNIDVESKSSGEADICFSYSEDNETITNKSELCVLPFGFIYDKTFNSFTGMNVALPLLMAALLLLTIVLSISFVEKYKQGNFSYSMAVLGGEILFTFLSLITTITDNFFGTSFEERLTRIPSLIYSLQAETGSFH